MPPDRPVLIAGPTASGKSALAARIVAEGGGVIVNADAMQVYARWRILTARPTEAETTALPHRLYGHVGRDEGYSVGHWLRDVAGVIAEGHRPVIVGGTGLYFAALTEGLAPIPPIPPDVRVEADALRLAGGVGRMTRDLDPATSARIELANPARVQRAWEVWRATGHGLAYWQRLTPPPLLALSSCRTIVLRPDRDWLAARIDARFDAMIDAGALDEVRRERPFWRPAQPSARAIGAPELMAHLEGASTLADAVAAAKRATRQYAKRQRTWFRNRLRDWGSVERP